MTFGWATDNAELRKVPTSELARRMQASSLATRYYTPLIHPASFCLPKYVEDAIAEVGVA